MREPSWWLQHLSLIHISREVDEMVRKQIEVLEARRAALKVSELNFNSFFDYSFDRLEPVSYTHLDVYKRQG